MIVSKYIYIHTNTEKNNIIINTLTGAIDIVNKEIATLLKNKDIKNIKLLDKFILSCLEKRGYVFDSNEQFNQILKKAYNKCDEVLDYKIYSILPTYNCNLACTYCFEGNLTTKNVSLTFEMIDKIFEYIKNDKNDKKKKMIQLFGGEPLLKSNLNIIERILYNSKKVNAYGIDIITNGTQLNYFSDLLLEYKNLIKSIQITIDGPRIIHDKRRIKKDGSGTFNEINANIKKFLELGFVITARTNVDNTNINQIGDLVQYYEDNFNTYKNFKYYFAPVRSTCSTCEKNILNEQEILEKIYNLRKKDFSIDYPLEGIKVLALAKNVLEEKNNLIKVMPTFYNCEAVNGSQILFGPDGKLYTCGQAVGNEELSIGTFFPDIFLDEKKFNMWKNLSVTNKKKCSQCSIAFMCGGGCAYSSWQNSHNLDNPEECSEKFNVLSTYLNKYKEKTNI